VGFRAGDGARQFDAAGVKPPSAVVGWAYLAAFLAAVCIRVCFVERVDGLVSLEVFLKEFETGLPCDCARHGWGSVWGVWRVEEAPCPCYICFLAPPRWCCGSTHLSTPCMPGCWIRTEGAWLLADSRICSAPPCTTPDVTRAIGSRARGIAETDPARGM
jgi:hypothetical protein